MRIFCNAKDSHIFSTKKKQCLCNINVLNFNEKLTNNVVNFEQPALYFSPDQTALAPLGAV